MRAVLLLIITYGAVAMLGCGGTVLSQLSVKDRAEEWCSVPSTLDDDEYAECLKEYQIYER